MLLSPIAPALRHIAVIGNALPRRCGLATYTSHSVAALREAYPDKRIDHYAMDDGTAVAYGADLAGTIDAADLAAYVRAAATIRESGAELLWVHHEFGIFGGSAGDHLLALLKHLDLPMVITLHTVLRNPDPDQMRVMRALIARADRLIVMAQAAADLLETVYRADPRTISVIPHGAPDRPFSATESFKRKLGLSSGPTVLTFGLLSPGKGIETAIEGIRLAVAEHPDLLYLVVGASHPTLVRQEGEAYRNSLAALVRSHGLGENICFVDRFLDDEDLLDYLQAADLYLTPYLGREQVTSGTLSYALAMGKPVISTPYIHASEALADGLGTLVPFGDGDAIGRAIVAHLADPDLLHAHALRVWKAARKTVWSQNARAVMVVLQAARAERPVPLWDEPVRDDDERVRLCGLVAMTDDVGIIQHSVKGIPDRRHGYCIDDNARALMLVSATRAGDPAERRRLTLTYAAFVEHAWHEEIGQFRNFMGFDRRWLEDRGSEDSNGRTLWALGIVLRVEPDPLIRDWATSLFNRALPLSQTMRSPRALAFAMLGMASMLKAQAGHELCREALHVAADRQIGWLAAARRPDWHWYESVLAYDNARLPQALIEAGQALDDDRLTRAGLATLAWLEQIQSAPGGHFRPVGTDGFGKPYDRASHFDQQPLEAAAMIDACLAAYGVAGQTRWADAARRAFQWFEGENDLGEPVRSADGTLCHDGLSRAGINLNIGAESLLAYQMARHSMGELAMIEDDVPLLLAV